MSHLTRLLTWLRTSLRLSRLRRDRGFIRVNAPPQPDGRDSIQAFKRIQAGRIR